MPEGSRGWRAQVGRSWEAACVYGVGCKRQVCVCLGVIGAATASGWFDSFRGILMPHAAPQRFFVHTPLLRKVCLGDGPYIPV